MLHRRAAQGTQTPRRGEKTQPIFRTIFGAMMLVLVAEILLLVISIYVTNVGGRLNQNAKDMLAMQVRNRVGYIGLHRPGHPFHGEYGPSGSGCPEHRQ